MLGGWNADRFFIRISVSVSKFSIGTQGFFLPKQDDFIAFKPAS